ncbi:MAG: glycosyltransferase family 2 protein [candidate division KSB1 bacterium]|nr:glycosyltransferase family 2 protein [candidate division KSB1 bacterium]
MSSCYIAILAYNEESTIESLIFDIAKYIHPEHILIVDDGSVDATAERARKSKCTVLSHPCNLGKGDAIRSAIRFGVAHKYRWMIMMDADLQHPPSSLPAFFHAIESDVSDVIIANRTDRQRCMPAHRQLSNGITSIMVSLVSGARIRDSQCGYRALRLDALKAMNFCERGFQVESEMLIKLGKTGSRFAEIPIRTVYTNKGSAIHPVRDTLLFAKLIFKSLTWQ